MENLKPLPYNPIFHNEVIYHAEQIWQRKLTDHERNLAALIHDITMTVRETEEIKIVEVAR